MANYFTNAINYIGDWFAGKLAPLINDRMGIGYSVLGRYYTGDQRPQLKTTQGKPDDNIFLNFIGLAVDRSVSRLFRGGLDWVLPEGAEAQQEYLNTLWDLNKKEIILYQAGLHGAVYGTGYFKMQPDGVEDPYTEKYYPRLIALDPEIVRVKTDPQDMNKVLLYQIRYNIGQNSYCEITRRSDVEYEINGITGEAMPKMPAPKVYTEGEEPTQESVLWIIDELEQSATYGNQMTLVRTTAWEYDFPPIIHWKNLPSLKSCYGDSDIDDSINVQDKENFTVSNIGKIIKYHASPQTVGTGFSADQVKQVDNAPNVFHAISNPDAKVYNLEMQSDLVSSREHAKDLRQSIFDISREIDLSSIGDKIGTLTNFGLRVLYSDAIDKNDTKRQLYGDALKELNRRLLVLGGYEKEASRPGDIQWGDPIPVNIKEEIEVDKLALELGVVDKETVAQRYLARYGVDWETIQERLANEQATANQENADIGAQILRNFNRGVVNG